MKVAGLLTRPTTGQVTISSPHNLYGLARPALLFMSQYRVVPKWVDLTCFVTPINMKCNLYKIDYKTYELLTKRFNISNRKRKVRPMNSTNFT